nr:unnamed protein product [Digitaria exilis]
MSPLFHGRGGGGGGGSATLLVAATSAFHNGSRNMASTAGIKCEDSGEPDNDEQDGRGTCVHDDEEKHARKKKRVTRDETFLRCGEGPPGARTVMALYTGWPKDGEETTVLQTVTRGSLIEITGPKRGIELCYATLIEYDMRIKTGKQEKDDLQLIDGVSLIDEMTTFARKPFTRQVQSNFSLCVGCFISGLHPEIRLFDGTISESRGLRRSVVAGVMDTWMDLKFKNTLLIYFLRSKKKCNALAKSHVPLARPSPAIIALVAAIERVRSVRRLGVRLEKHAAPGWMPLQSAPWPHA